MNSKDLMYLAYVIKNNFAPILMIRKIVKNIIKIAKIYDQLNFEQQARADWKLHLMIRKLIRI